jgi:molybdenum cofactor biosynthesis protein B
MKEGHAERHPHIRDVSVTVAVVTVSTTRSTGTDESGRIIQDLCEEAGMQVTHYAVVPDLVQPIRQEFFRAAAVANCIIITGGTGLTRDDCTIEAIQPLLEKVIDGFGEVFRARSYAEIGAASVLSRALGGVTGGKAVFCIPGSPGAVRLATKEVIIPVVRHVVSHAGN